MTSSEPDDNRPYTAPENISISLRGFDTEERATAFGNMTAVIIRILSRDINLSHLDGVTFAYDYANALAELDRGTATSTVLTASSGNVVGIAMSPAVLRDGTLKTHIVFEAGLMHGLDDPKHDNFPLALHTLAHECAHVEINHIFDTAFPNVLLRKQHSSLLDGMRSQVILACWDEYAATRICALYGRDPTTGYEETFLTSLNSSRESANKAIIDYRLHCEIPRVFNEACIIYANLMKYSCYHIGNMVGRGLSLESLPNTMNALDGHWYFPYFKKLEDICGRIWGQYGKWEDFTLFDEIGDLLEELLAEGGLHIYPNSDGGFYLDIPFSSETMPQM